MEFMERLGGVLPEVLLTLVIAFQGFLFRQVSEARREHLQLRVEIAQTYTTSADLERALDRLEAGLRAQHHTLLTALKQRTTA
ncbi:hypothetical protein FQZ97_1268180 [compost metagenome]